VVNDDTLVGDGQGDAVGGGHSSAGDDVRVNEAVDTTAAMEDVMEDGAGAPHESEV
jgi:hypothetical protein